MYNFFSYKIQFFVNQQNNLICAVFLSNILNYCIEVTSNHQNYFNQKLI